MSLRGHFFFGLLCDLKNLSLLSERDWMLPVRQKPWPKAPIALCSIPTTGNFGLGSGKAAGYRLGTLLVLVTNHQFLSCTWRFLQVLEATRQHVRS